MITLIVGKKGSGKTKKLIEPGCEKHEWQRDRHRKGFQTDV